MRRPGDKKERLSGEERRAEILDAALRLFAAKGFSGTRTREIASAAGISETLIFQHFKTKEQLYRAALGRIFAEHPVMPDVQEMMAGKDDLGVFRTVALHLIRHNRQDPRIMRLAVFSALEGFSMAELVHQGKDTVGPPLPELLSSYIRQRVRDGAFKKVDADVVGKLFVDTMYAFVLDQETSISGPPLGLSDEETVDVYVRVLVDGLRA